jgi:hypothetical protein
MKINGAGVNAKVMKDPWIMNVCDPKDMPFDDRKKSRLKD